MLGALVIPTANNGPAIRLLDIAQLAETTTPRPAEELHIRIRLQEGADREATLAALARELEAVRAELPPGMTVAPYTTEASAPARFALCGPDRARLAELSRDAHHHGPPPRPASFVRAIDRARAATAGVDASELARAIGFAIGQPVATGDGAMIVLVPEGEMGQLPVRTPNGLTPLSAVTTAATQDDDPPRDRVDRLPAVLLDDQTGVPSTLPPGYTLRPM